MISTPHTSNEVLHLITTLSSGGAERTLSRLVIELKQCQDQSHQVVALTGTDFYGKTLSAQGVVWENLRCTRNPISFFFACLSIRRTLIKSKVRVLQSWLYHSDLVATLIALSIPKRNRPKIIWNIRCSDVDFKQYSILTRFTVWALARLSNIVPTVIIANSEAGRRAHEHLGYRNSRWQIIPNGIDLSSLKSDIIHLSHEGQKEPVSPAHIGLVARFDPMKGHKILLDAISILKSKGVQVRLTLVGRGIPGAKPLRNDIESLGLGAITTLVPEQLNLIPTYDSLDIFCLPSLYGEGFPNVVLEAMAMGLPVVATDVGDCKYILGSDEWIVPPNDPKALADKLEKLIQLGPEEWQKIGASNRLRVEQEFTLKKMVDNYYRLYSSLVKD